MLLPFALLGTVLVPSVARAQAATIGFGWSHLKTTAGAEIKHASPTSLQFGPDGRLYVAYQDGTIRAFTITRQAANDYRATAVETITAVKNTPNHDDNGQPNATVTERLLLGIAVTGTATSPVIYAAHSDPRFGSLTGELDLDTNSGMISRLVKSGGSWTKTDIVRGLPRSREIHAPNGLALKNNKLYIGIGGNTNHGAPSVAFGLAPEYALSTAILEIDLAAITSPPYDIPTLNDPDRAGDPDANDPFGGNGGKNQAEIVSGGPVKVWAAGFRNAYDVVWHSNGALYAMDNGGNAAGGSPPIGEGPAGTCTNAQNDGGLTDRDGLYRVTAAGYYQGHPNPTRANRSNTFAGQSPVPVGMATPIECDYQTSGGENGSYPKDANNDGLTFFNFSTNGITEYTASNFGNAMKGNLLVAQLDINGTGTVHRIALNASGGFSSRAQLPVAGYGTDPLDVWAQPDAGPFPGTIWIAMYGSDEVTILEPSDFGGGTPPTCTGADDPSIDEDADGFDNADEIDNATDPCSAGSVPPDNDGDKTSDLNDPNDDNDALTDLTDPFQTDPNNGTTTTVPKRITWNATDPDPGGIIGSGFTGLMTNGSANYSTLYDPGNMTVGSAAGVFTIDQVPAGDAFGSFNNQQYGFQFGFDAPSEPFVAHTVLTAPFSGATPQDNQSFGLMLGTGDQQNYVKVVASANSGAGGISFLKEVNGTVSNSITASAAILNADLVDLYLAVDPVAGTVQPRYRLTTGCATTCQQGPITNLGVPVTIPAGWLTGTTGTAVGVISTSRSAPTFAATWDEIEVTLASGGGGGGGGTGQWVSKAPSGFPREELSYTEVGGTFYLAGGLAPSGGNAARQQAYNPTTNTWSDVAPLPTPVHHVQAVAVNGKIYYIGGISNATGAETGVVQIYDPVTNSFSSGAPMPRPRGAGGVAVHQGDIYYAGGFRPADANALNWFDRYDPDTNTWTQLPNMPLTRDHFHAQVVNGKFYALGGRNKKLGGLRSNNAVYNFTTGTWSTAIAPIPTVRGGHSTAVVNGEILVIGGEGGGQVWNTVEAYNPATNTWRTLPPMPTARHGIQAVAFQGDVYVAAGSRRQGGGLDTDVHEMLDLGTGGGGGGGDTQAPTAPTGLQATAVSATRVDLSWTAATDNVGVDTYVVQRAQGGTFSTIGTVNAPTTTFADTSVAASTTYQYRVQACDAVPNCGPFSATDQVTTPSGGGGGGTGLVFSDGFETGFAWDTVKPDITRQSTQVHAGSFGVRAVSNSTTGAAFARTGIGATMTDVFYRTYFKTITKGSNEVILMRALGPANSWVMSFGLTTGGNLMHKKHVNGGLTTASAVAPSTGAWHELEVHVTTTGASSLVEVWLDGTQIPALTKTFDLGTGGIANIQIGDSTVGRTYDVAFDDVAVDESPIP